MYKYITQRLQNLGVVTLVLNYMYMLICDQIIDNQLSIFHHRVELQIRIIIKIMYYLRSRNLIFKIIKEMKYYNN